MRQASKFSHRAAGGTDMRSSLDFERLILPHRQAALNLARWLLRHDQDAEDCVQESFFRAYRAFGQFRGEDARGWLMAIVRNGCYLQIRQRKRVGISTPFDEALHTQSEDPHAVVLIEHDLLAHGLLPRALDRLPPETRAILVLRDIDGLAYKDIRLLMGIPLGTVMSRLSRAREKLQLELRRLLRDTSAFDYISAAR